MQIMSPHPYPERILVYGGGGVGKTKGVMEIALHCPDSNFWIVDNDTSFAYTRQVYSEYSAILDYGPDETHDFEIKVGSGKAETIVSLTVHHVGNLRIIEIGPAWEEFTAAVKHAVGYFDKAQFIKGLGDPENDWFVVDSATSPWQYVQAWYSQQVHGADLSEHMLKVRQTSADLKEYNKILSGDMTWPLINREYMDRFIRPMHKWRGHVYLTAEAANVGKDDDDQDKLIYGTIGMKPKGQNSLHHQMSSNLFLYQGAGVWKITTAKDRGRERMWQENLDSFARDYLVGIAGWKIVPGK